MAYPDDSYPTAPSFPTAADDIIVNDDLYGVMTSYIEDISSDLATVTDEDGNIDLAAAKWIEWDGNKTIWSDSGTITVDDLKVTTELRITGEYTGTDTTVTDHVDITTYLDITSGASVSVGGTITCDYVQRNYHIFNEATAPGNPANDYAVFWMDDGGVGLGDFMVKITEGGSTKTATLLDWSAL